MFFLLLAIVNQKKEKFDEHNWTTNVIEELTNHGDEHQQHRIVIENNIFYNSNSCNNVNHENDVQSMDAIERRDFINEQGATGNCLLGTSSLINNTIVVEPRLNLGILEISQKMEKLQQLSHKIENLKKLTLKTVVEEQVSKRSAENMNANDNSSAQKNTSDQLISTPTTSRTKRYRLSSFASEKNNAVSLAKSLEKCAKIDNESTLDWDVSHGEQKMSLLCDDINHIESSNIDDTASECTTSKTNQTRSCTVCSSCNKENARDNKYKDVECINDDDKEINEDEEENKEDIR